MNTQPSDRLQPPTSLWDALRGIIGRVTASGQGWVNHVRFGDTWGLRRAVLGAPTVVPPPWQQKDEGQAQQRDDCAGGEGQT
jgi:hypothetical protein